MSPLLAAWSRDALARYRIGVGHKSDRSFRAVFARQIEGMFAAAQVDAEPRVTGGEMHEHGLGCAIDHVLKSGRIHEQLPVVLVRSKIE